MWVKKSAGVMARQDDPAKWNTSGSTLMSTVTVTGVFYPNARNAPPWHRSQTKGCRWPPQRRVEAVFADARASFALAAQETPLRKFPVRLNRTGEKRDPHLAVES